MEEWKDIPDYEGHYQVSSEGHVRSLDRMVSAGPAGQRLVPGQYLATKTIKGGYLTVSLSRQQKSRQFGVHTLVMLAFRGPRPAGTEVCHNNGIPNDNRLDNLRYDTRKNNHQDKRAHGTMARGSKINTSKLTEEQVVAMRFERVAGATVEALATSYGVSSVAVSKICIGDHWAHVGGPIRPRMKRNMGEKYESKERHPA